MWEGYCSPNVTVPRRGSYSKPSLVWRWTSQIPSATKGAAPPASWSTKDPSPVPLNTAPLGNLTACRIGQRESLTVLGAWHSGPSGTEWLECEEGNAAVRTWSRLAPRSRRDVRVSPRRPYRAIVFILQILKLKIGVQVVCKGFWGLGGSSTPSGPLKIRGTRSGGSGRTPEGRFQVIY